MGFSDPGILIVQFLNAFAGDSLQPCSGDLLASALRLLGGSSRRKGSSTSSMRIVRRGSPKTSCLASRATAGPQVVPTEAGLRWNNLRFGVGPQSHKAGLDT